MQARAQACAALFTVVGNVSGAGLGALHWTVRSAQGEQVGACARAGAA